MKPHLLSQYYSMMNNIATDKYEQGQAVLANIMGEKFATRLIQHNAETAQLNAAAFKTDSALGAKLANS